MRQAALIAAALAAVDAAGAVLRPLFRTQIAADIKQDDSPVTEADRRAEQVMRATLRAHTPDIGIIGEEFPAERLGEDWCWAIDPIDGTRAFITGRPSFGTLVALLRDGVPVIGVIDQPVTGERWVGVQGAPTLFTGPLGGQVGCRPCGDLALAELSATSPEIFGADWPRFNALAGQARRVVWGGDCYGYGLLALGMVDMVAESGLKLWDWAALVPVVEGAGGLMRDWDGQILRAGGDGRALAVGDGALLAPALAALRA